MGLFTGNGAYSEAENNWKKYLSEADNYYKGLANQGLNNSAYQSVLQQQRDMLKDTLRTQAATAKITGATPAQQAIAKQQAYKSLSDTTSQLGARVSDDSRAAMQNYFAAAQQATQGINSAKIAQDQAESAAISGLIGAGTNFVSGGLGLLKK